MLQGLTGVRLELRAIANESEASESVRQQLVSLERALAMEQRELRFFISGLEPSADHRVDPPSPLVSRLDTPGIQIRGWGFCSGSAQGFTTRSW